MSISKTDERIGRLYLQLGGREDLSSKVLDEMELTRKWVVAAAEPPRPGPGHPHASAVC